jgi:8-oxo-dGTP pyrophosphatase MutT (NUDIX family)
LFTLRQVRAALQLPSESAAHNPMLPARQRPTPPPDTKPRLAGVLALLFGEDGDLRLLLTCRPDTLRNHAGQVSFPGGSMDAHDADLTATALRETCEEVGICDEDITILGHLNRIYIPPSNFEVLPTVGYLHQLPPLQLSIGEVTETLHVPLAWLLDETLRGTEMRNFRGYEFEAPYYHFFERKVWGATAAMLGELELRLGAISVL